MATAVHLPTLARESRREPAPPSWPGLAAGVLDLLREAALLVSADCVLLGGNREAERLLRSGDGLARAGARLVAATGRSTAALHEGIARASLGEVAHLQLPRLGGTPLILRIEPYPSRALSRSVVVFAREQGARRPCAGELSARFGLTPTEGSVAERMSAGLRPECIAQEFGVKLSTVRGHLKHIFEKTGTHRQAELVAKLFSES